MSHPYTGNTDRRLTPQRKKSPLWALHFIFYPILIALVINSFISGEQQLNLPVIFPKHLSPHELYSQKLEAAEAYNIGIGKDWISAGQKALEDSLEIKLPYQETGFYSQAEVRAISYAIQAKDGEVLDIQLELVSEQPTAIFLDLFWKRLGRSDRYVAHADSGSLQLRYEVRENGLYLLRLQPELMRTFQYTISITKQPQLAFPVDGKDHSAVGSFWGAPRDGGRRKHKGIDIFAKKGTPVLAATEGTVSRVRNGGLGGKTVWLRDANRRQSLYYAHLDTQMVRRGQRVQIGDTLGLVGNTGNARYTPPHLHFGVYRSNRGAVDPYPYVFLPKKNLKPIPSPNIDKLSHWVHTKNGSYELNINESTQLKLPKFTALKVIATNNSQFRVQLPDGQEGWIATRYINNRNEHIELKSTTSLRYSHKTNAPLVAKISQGKWVKILGKYMDATLISVPPDGLEGWILNSDI